MRKLGRLDSIVLGVCLALALMLAACASPTPRATPGDGSIPHPIGVSPTSGTAFKPLPTPASTATSLPTVALENTPAVKTLPSLLLLLEDENATRFRARPIDPASLADLPGYAPLDFGNYPIYSLSPDGRTVAALILSENPEDRRGVLHLMDLDTWHDKTTNVTTNDQVRNLSFSPDGKALYWIESTRLDSRTSLPRDYALHRYDLVSGQASLVTNLPSAFSPEIEELHPLSSGRALAIYGIPTDAAGNATDAPHVLIVDVSANGTSAPNRIAADVRLNGVKAGQYPLATTTPNSPDAQWFAPGLAWDMSRSLLYVVHPEGDQLTIVDLAKGDISRRAAIRRRTSFLEELMDWLVPTAEAKGLPSIGARTVLSPDGMRLYVVSSRSDADEPLGRPRVIDTRDWTEIRQLDPPTNGLALSPDGRWLLSVGAQIEVVSGGGRSSYEDSGIYVYDDGLEERGHSMDRLVLRGFSRDSHYAYAGKSRCNNGAGCSDTLELLNLPSLRPVRQRELGMHFWDLVGSARYDYR